MQPTNNVELILQGLGNVPSFKNSKMLTRGKLITKPEAQAWMQRATRSLEFQLLSAIRATNAGISTANNPQFWIALSEQFDDSVQWMPEISASAVKCAKGEEWVRITISILWSEHHG